MMTLEAGRSSTWRLPRFSAFVIVFKASANTLMRTILTVGRRQPAAAHGAKRVTPGPNRRPNRPQPAPGPQQHYYGHTRAESRTGRR